MNQKRYVLCGLMLLIAAFSVVLYGDRVVPIRHGQARAGAAGGCTVVDLYAATQLLALNPDTIDERVVRAIIDVGAQRYRDLVAATPGAKPGRYYDTDEACHAFPALEQIDDGTLTVFSSEGFAQGSGAGIINLVDVNTLAQVLQDRSRVIGRSLCGVYTHYPYSYLLCYIDNRWLFFDSHDPASVNIFDSAAAMQTFLHGNANFRITGPAWVDIKAPDGTVVRQDIKRENRAILTLYQLAGQAPQIQAPQAIPLAPVPGTVINPVAAPVNIVRGPASIPVTAVKTPEGKLAIINKTIGVYQTRLLATQKALKNKKLAKNRKAQLQKTERETRANLNKAKKSKSAVLSSIKKEKARVAAAKKKHAKKKPVKKHPAPKKKKRRA